MIALVCVLIGFMIAVQFRTVQDTKGSISQQRIEELSDRLLQTEHERDELGEELRKVQTAAADAQSSVDQEMLRYRAALLPLTGEGVIVRMDDSTKIRAIGDKKSLENSLKMRGGVVETLSVWGIQLDITVSDDVYIPPYRGSVRQTYAHETEERTEE